MHAGEGSQDGANSLLNASQRADCIRAIGRPLLLPTVRSQLRFDAPERAQARLEEPRGILVTPIKQIVHPRK